MDTTILNAAGARYAVAAALLTMLLGRTPRSC